MSLISRYSQNMSGVDLLWVILHFIDFAVAASLLKFRFDCNHLPKIKMLDSFYFRLDIVKCLLSDLKKKAEPRPRGKPSFHA
jgi:hypothetical protein